MVLLGALILIAVLVAAITAFVRAERLRDRLAHVPRLIERVYALEQEVARLERSLAETLGTPVSPGAAPAVPSIETSAPVTPPSAAPPVALAAVPQAPAAAREAEVRPPARGVNFETLIAGRWLNYVGILALFFAVAFFLKYAFENNWVGPRGRVAIGLLIGSSLFPWSHRLLDRGYRYFSEGIAGLGAAVLYVSLWAGWHYYHIFPQSAAFALMIVVTAATAVVAIGRNSERIAVLSLLGGVATPQLVSTGRNQELILFSYLAILGAGMLGLSRARNWKTIPPIQFVATLIYFWAWYATFYRSSALGLTTFFATLFFLLFAALPVARSRREGELSGVETVIVLVNALAYLVALRVLLWPEHRWALTLAVLALGTAHIAAERAMPEKRGPARRIARVLYAGLALMFVTLAIPIRLDGKWITIAWAVEGVILIWSGLRIRVAALQGTGLLLFLVVAGRLAFFPIAAERFLWNARFLTFAVCAASFVAPSLFARRSRIELAEWERDVYQFFAIAANVCFLAALSMDVWDLLGRRPSLGIDRGLAQQLALSALWLAYAIGLLAAGLYKKSAPLRWQALALLGIVIGKVFLFDLSFLQRFYRIVSFLLLGLALLLISFFYQRRLAAKDGDKR